MNNVKTLLMVAILGTLGASQVSFASDPDYGCRALMCFVGGVAYGGQDCADTAKQVYKDIAKGRGFPFCNMTNSNGTPDTADMAANHAEVVTKWVKDIHAFGGQRRAQFIDIYQDSKLSDSVQIP
jgi:hypothetical protein